MASRIKTRREVVCELINNCFCDDGRGLPECNICVALREVLELIKKEE